MMEYVIIARVNPLHQPNVLELAGEYNLCMIAL